MVTIPLRPAAALLAAALSSAVAAASPAGPFDGLRPDRVFTQWGAGRGARTTVIGAAWDWRFEREFAGGRLGGYWEVSLGRWSADRGAGDASAWISQLGVTPVLRWQPAAWGERWFVEAGVGANLIAPVFRSGGRRFSTVFNFGDHVALGRRFGDGGRHEVSLRLQHFSNAGLRRPNPGADFVQLRYALAL